MSDPTDVSRSTGSTVPAGSVTSRYAGAAALVSDTGVAAGVAAALGAGAAADDEAGAPDANSVRPAAWPVQAAVRAIAAETVINRFMTPSPSDLMGCKATASPNSAVFPWISGATR